MITFSYTSNEIDDSGAPIVFANAVGVLAIGEPCFLRYHDFLPNADPKQQGTFSDRVRITFYIYRSAAQYRRGKGLLARKDYDVPADQWDVYFSRAALRTVNAPAQGGSNDPIEYQCEKFALATLDTNGKSFFDGGVQS